MNVSDYLRRMGVDPLRCTISRSAAEVMDEEKRQQRKAGAATSPRFQQRRAGDRYKSDREREYAEVLDAELAAGRIVRWSYEAVKLFLPDWGWYAPDFYVAYDCGHLEFREIKGRGKFALRDRGKAKFLDARRIYPEFGWRMIQLQPNGEWLDVL
jgi:hypothetical protein